MSNDSMSNTVTQQSSKVNSKKENYISLWNNVANYCKPSEFPIAITVPTYLVHYLGDANKALFLSQLIYWSDRGTRTDGYFYKTKKEFERETGLKERSMQRYEEEFIAKGWLDTKLLRSNGHFTKHYKLDMNKLTNQVLHNCDARGIILPSKSKVHK